jgi:putative ABC transport system substrate-binding protein
MRRRTLLASLSAWPAIARAQAMPRVGFLHPGKVDPSNMRLATFADGLRSKGYTDGKTVSIVIRAAEFDSSRIAQYAAELIDSKVDVLFAIGSKVIQESRQRTSTIPIVALDLESDPVASGFVKSLAHPGGNVTGLFFDFAEFSGKWLEIMGEIVPGLKSAGVIWDPATGKVQIDAATTVAKHRGVALEIIECDVPSAIERGFQQAADRKVQAVLVLSSPVFGTVPQLVSGAALKHKLPTITMFPEFAEMGGLVAYGTDQRDLFRQSGEIVGRVLAGTRPADLPVERPTRILLAVNMKTAAALGVTIPKVVLLRADQVIE